LRSCCQNPQTQVGSGIVDGQEGSDSLQRLEADRGIVWILLYVRGASFVTRRRRDLLINKRVWRVPCVSRPYKRERPTILEFILITHHFKHESKQHQTLLSLLPSGSSPYKHAFPESSQEGLRGYSCPQKHRKVRHFFSLPQYLLIFCSSLDYLHHKLTNSRRHCPVTVRYAARSLRRSSLHSASASVIYSVSFD
jgi:hypothetical protein